MDQLNLPPAPSHLGGPVKAWAQAVSIATYPPAPADKNPMFLEKRVYQGSSGRVYPLPYTDRIAEKKSDQIWQAVHIENEFVRLMVLPELGGRIHVGLDKTSGYDFFYRQNVIKPALVGLAGPWISGGVEFNWPQHHRPSTFMPADVHIENHPDGSATIWCSEHEPMNRMKGMHGICLHPGKSLIELKVRLFNRTPMVQTFLWWANVAARVHEQYQSFFPPDVNYVADHAKRAMSRFPLSGGLYYGVDYGRRGRDGVAKSELPRQFIPPGDYAANDLSWYANIPVPTSYMAMGSREDFFGGYDHAAQAGFLHVANHHVSPGKKQWTWGNHEFGYAWDRNLTESDGPYIELMAGVYTDNQPDFSFLHPGETRTFSQFWYPIQKIGPAQKANIDAAISLKFQDEKVIVGVAVTSKLAGAKIRLDCRGKPILELRTDLGPDKPLLQDAAIPGDCKTEELRLSVIAADGRGVIEYQAAAPKKSEVPLAATEPAPPSGISSADELFFTGQHLEQYRHATRAPEIYWQEALNRDPGDSRCNNAMGLWHLRRGEFGHAATYFLTAVARITRRNPNPYDGEFFYNLGLALRHLGRDEESYDAFYKSTWNYAWQSPAFFALAELDCRQSRWAMALEHLDRCLRVNVEHLQARNLKAIVLRKLGSDREADELLRQTLAIDPLDFWARYLLVPSPCTQGEGQGGGYAAQPAFDPHPNPPPEYRERGKFWRGTCDTSVLLDLALDFARAGFYREAIELLRGAVPEPASGTAPLVQYYQADFLYRAGDEAAAKSARVAAKLAPPDYCFPARLEEIAILQSAIDADSNDARARYYLGNLFYDRRRHGEAIQRWEASAKIDPTFSIVWRNLGIGFVNISKNLEAARVAYDKALAANPSDARLLYERDQLRKKMRESPANRLMELEKLAALAQKRDDLTVELCALYNQTGRPREALKLLESRRFQPWEGGEGQALGQYSRAHVLLGRLAMKNRDAGTARKHFESALAAPENLAEAKHLLANQSDIHFWIATACEALGDRPAAERHWNIAAESSGDFQEMSVRAFSGKTYYSALSLAALGQNDRAKKLLADLLMFAKDLATKPSKVDYFATSLPDMLLFEDDLNQRQKIESKFLSAQANLGLGDLAAGQSLLREVLEVNPSHALAADLLTGDFQPCAT